MGLNKIQIHIFKKLCNDNNMDSDEYIRRFSQEYLCKQVDTFEELSEKDADEWITKAYLQSLENQ